MDDGQLDSRKNRTWLCSVLFADIAKFSEGSVAQQTESKATFNELAKDCLQRVAPIDRILIDTGDGIAVCFMGDPEDAILTALDMRAACTGGEKQLEVRIGINLGPVKIVTDLNGQNNAIGDGINVAQRVMSFADPGQVLCSRTYYDIVSRISEDYMRLFQYSGVRRDKHVREHDIYEASPMPVGISETLTAPVTPREAGVDSGEWLDRIVALATRKQGPLAILVARRALAGAKSRQDVVSALAAEFDSAQEQSLFLEEASKLAEY